MSSNIRIVLCRPEGGLNIGAVCRAMMNTGLTDLVLVRPDPSIDEKDIRMMAVHSFGIYEKARKCDTLKEALENTVLSAGITRRRGSKRKRFSLLPEEISEKAVTLDGITALVFGNEQNGLSDDELNCCSTAAHIPSNPDHPSYNLSHAVQILTYSCYRARERKVGRYTPVPKERIEEVTGTVIEVLTDLGYFDKQDRFDVPQYLHDIFSRAAMSEKEAAYMIKMFEKVRILKKG